MKNFVVVLKLACPEPACRELALSTDCVEKLSKYFAVFRAEI